MPVCLLGGTYNADYDEKTGYHVKCNVAAHDLAAYQAAQTGAKR